MNTESPSLSNLLNNQTRRPGYAKTLFGKDTFVHRRWMILPIVGIPLAVAVYPFAIHAANSRQLATATKMLHVQGGYLRLDLVDGNYVVDLPKRASLKTVSEIVAELKRLPTGFTYVGPGEERLFWINSPSSKLSDDSISELSQLRISSIALSGQLLTDEAAATLASMQDLSLITIGDCKFSSDAILNLRAAKPSATIILGGEDGNAK